jgi:hypothetical protein
MLPFGTVSSECSSARPILFLRLEKIMSNAFRAWNDWFSLSSQAATVALETQSVIALRLMRIAAGGTLARSEATRMVTEKAQALGEAQAAAFGSMTGRNRRHIAKKDVPSTARVAAGTLGASSIKKHDHPRQNEQECYGVLQAGRARAEGEGRPSLALHELWRVVFNHA